MLLLLDDLFSDDSQETGNGVPCVGTHTWEQQVSTLPVPLGSLARQTLC